MTRILFIGDSITDAGRREDQEEIGTGYVKLIHDYLKVSHPAKTFDVINRGISGDRAIDLATRWEADVIDHQPDIVSISIGINDVWQQIDDVPGEKVCPKKYEEVYTDLLRQVKNQTNAQIVLMEPTVIQENIDSPGNQKLKQYVKIVRELAETFGAIIVPTHEVFIEYLQHAKPYPLTTDGVHMNGAGNMLMAKTWLETMNAEVFDPEFV